MTAGKHGNGGIALLTAAIAAFFALPLPADAGSWLGIAPDGNVQVEQAANPAAPRVTVIHHDESGMKVRIDLAGIEIEEERNEIGEFVRLTLPQCPLAGDVGAPAYPVVRRLFSTRDGACVNIRVDAGEPTSFNLGDSGLSGRLFPRQAPKRQQIDASDDSAALVQATPFAFEASAYAGGSLTPSDRISITELGLVRGRRLWLLEVRPVAVEAATATISMWRRLDVNVTFSGGTRAPDWLRPSAGMNRAVLNPELGALKRDDPGNYLIVTADEFAGSAPLNEFIAAKTAQGFNVLTYHAVTGSTLYDIMDYIEGLWGTPDAPDYILLVGDAVDNGITVGPYSLPLTTGRTDLYYGCMDGEDDWYPDIAVGRWPIEVVSDLQNIVDKTLCVEDELYAVPSFRQRAMFIAGSDPEADAEAHHEWIIDTYMAPAGVDPVRVYTDSLGSTTQDMSEGFNSGCFYANYFAHAATVQRWSTPSFDLDDIDALTNQNMYPFLMGFTCNSALFSSTLPEHNPCMLEKFLRVQNKGIACGYGSTFQQSPYTWDHWWDVYRFAMEAFYHDGIREVGPATQAGIAHFVAHYGPEDDVSLAMSRRWVVLGDPSFRLPTPPPKNYLMVVAPDFVDSNALADFVAAKEQNRGFNVTTYKPASGTSNTAIKNYIAGLWGTADEPDYVLLVGDADNNHFTVDHDTIPYWEGDGSKHSPTDWPYVCMDGSGDWYPEISIGRFSIRTEAQLQAVVDKTLFIEAGNFSDPEYVRRGAFLANPDTNGQAEPTHDWVIDNYFEPNDYTGIKLYASQGADTADVANAVNTGSLFTLYFGHSGSSGWWDPSFYESDVYALTNAGLYGLAFGWSCNSAYFLESECFGEAWIRAADRGAAAYISASDYIYWGSASEWAPSVALEKAFFAAFFEDDIWEIGPAWRAGLYRFLADYGGWDGDPTHPPTLNQDKCHNFFDEFVILGDPSLKLPQPNDYRVVATPGMDAVCSPPDTETSYIVEVQKVGNYGGSVILSASGLPPGASVSFDANDEYPPFTSMMTISDLTGVTPDTYEIQIDASSSGDVRSTTVLLAVSDTAPAIPVLATPIDGATGISREPVLAWQPTAAASTYDLQIATDIGFANVVYSETVTATSHTVGITLDSNTVYFWRVRASNGCSDSGYSAAYNFTTIDLTEYFTEEFVSGDAFDLDSFCIMLEPDGSGSYYAICGDSRGKFYANPENGTPLAITEDGSATVTLSGKATVQLYGITYNRFYVNDNGNITFETPDGTWTESLEDHFGQPRVSPLFDDYTVSNGTVSYEQLADRVAVTYLDVPQYGSSDSNNFQVEMFFTGEIRLTWLRVDSADGIVGISSGDGLPPDFSDMDLSSASTCFPTGACCIGEACSIRTEDDCNNLSGYYQGDNTSCYPNPCQTYDPSCLIISEVVQGKESGDCPRWMEITNTGAEDFAFFEGGVIVQTDASSDLVVDIPLAGLVIPAGESIVINSNAGGSCTGAFDAIYGTSADVYTQATMGYGNERLILTDTADGSHLIDIYGEFGVDCSGTPWEFTDGYSYRLSEWASGYGGQCDTAEWFLGGVGSLDGPFPTQLLLNNTTPGSHTAGSCVLSVPSPDVNCDGVTDLEDVACFVQGLLGNQAGWRTYLDATYPGQDRCLGYRWGLTGDLSGDGVANGGDIELFIDAVIGP